jgi:hypothetical protein
MHIGLSEQPLEVGCYASFLLRMFWIVDHESVAAILGTIEPFAKPASPISD